MKRIAICFSGQPRTWEKCSDTWDLLFHKIEEKFNAEVDIFCQAWDFNTSSHAVVINKPVNFLQYTGVAISEEEKKRLVNVMQPKDFIFENETASLSSVYQTLNRNRNQIMQHGASVIPWASSQFYAIMRSAHLKKKYEFEHGFKYDMCLRMRYDLFFDEGQLGCLLGHDLEMPEYNTLYSCHTSRDEHTFPYVRLGDVFWYSDSVTFDRICDFYRWYPVIGKKSFPNSSTGTEHTLYFYAKMLNMTISPILVDPKIFREASYLDKKIEAGLTGGLGNHELI